MTGRGGRRLARALFALILLEVLLGATLQILTSRRTGESWIAAGDIGFIVAFILFPFVGLLIASRRPDNALGWLMLAIGLIAFEPVTGFGEYALAADLPGARWAIAATTWSWIPTIGLAGTFVLLLFPDGHLPSPRWRWFAWTIAIGMVVASFAILASPGSLADYGHPEIDNPFGIEAIEPLLVIGIVAIATIPLGVLGSAFSLVRRYRRSGPTERLQIRWLSSAAAIVAVVYAIAIAVTAIGSTIGWATEGGWVGVLDTVAILLFALVPISIGIAVLRYRLYEIDVVIRKAVVAAAIAVFFTGVYIAVVGGIGAVVQAHSTTALSFVAAAVIAALFQPVLVRSRHLADRVVYGRRATPYEVLTRFSERVAGAYATEDVLDRMVQILAEGTGAASARVWLRVADVLRPEASWPSDGPSAEPVTITNDGLPELGGFAIEVRHRGELLGALSVEMEPNDPMSPAKERLAGDLASQAGLVLRNVRLVEELRASQRRIVAAQDAERQRLERNIHDGSQQQLVALSVKARLARGLMQREPEEASEILTQIEQDLQIALDDLRDLARGIYPPLLADQGLGAALEAQARRAALPVRVETDGIGRYSQEVEAAVYFSCLEALQNASKYAGANNVSVTLDQSNGHLRFEVADDGRGFDPSAMSYGTGLQGIADRLAALHGELTVSSHPGAGTKVIGSVEVRS